MSATRRRVNPVRESAMAPWNLHTLFTAEDTFSFHKTLGIACLFSYAYRFANVGESDMKFDASNATLFWIAVHAALRVVTHLQDSEAADR